MNPDDLLDRLRAETAHIAAFAADRDLTVPVPSCPGMTTGEVVRHLGSVYRRITSWVRDQASPDTWEHRPADGVDLIDWYRSGAITLCDLLAGWNPEAPCDTWSPWDRTAGFWWRRMAHETTVHRADVESAYGPIGAIDPKFAADGVDEVLTLFLCHRLSAAALPIPDGSSTRAADQIIGVAAGSHLWRVVLGVDHAEVAQELPHDADAVILGDAAGVYLWSWGRRAEDAIRISGDHAAVTALRDALARATQ
jgi:uncharacterized protein (TIGR03083 family)